MNTSHTQFAIVDYLKQHPRQYIDVEELQVKLLKRSNYVESFNRAIQDLLVSGRLEMNKNKVKINQ